MLHQHIRYLEETKRAGEIKVANAASKVVITNSRDQISIEQSSIESQSQQSHISVLDSCEAIRESEAATLEASKAVSKEMMAAVRDISSSCASIEDAPLQLYIEVAAFYEATSDATLVSDDKVGKGQLDAEIESQRSETGAADSCDAVNDTTLIGHCALF